MSKPMSDELKSQSIDTPEFRCALGAYVGALEGQDTRRKIEQVRAALIAHIDAWGARLAADTAKDSARLDFMIAEECQIERMDRPGTVPLYRLRWPWTEEHYRYWSGTGRDAIDAAIEAKEPPCGS